MGPARLRCLVVYFVCVSVSSSVVQLLGEADRVAKRCCEARCAYSRHCMWPCNHRSGQVYWTRALLKSHLCAALLSICAMQKCSPVVCLAENARAGQCTANPLQSSARFAHYP